MAKSLWPAGRGGSCSSPSTSHQCDARPEGARDLPGRPPRTICDFVIDHRDRFTGAAARQWVKVKTPGLIKD